MSGLEPERCVKAAETNRPGGISGKRSEPSSVPKCLKLWQEARETEMSSPYVVSFFLAGKSDVRMHTHTVTHKHIHRNAQLP